MGFRTGGRQPEADGGQSGQLAAADCFRRGDLGAGLRGGGTGDARGARKGLERRVYAPLLREVFARCAGFLVLVLGLYVTLRIANLTHLALTILGGTGLLGLVLGIAFGNITENFLASILLSMQQPFHVGDLIKVEDVLGYVQRLTTRTTVIATVDGNEVQIPNATIYKSIIRNFSTIPNCRVDFEIGVPRSDVDGAQERAMQVLKQHPVILKEPEPTVLVASVSDASVTLRVYFWINGRENSWLKVRSSVTRLVLHAIDRREEPSPASTGKDAASRARAETRKRSTTRSLHDQSASAQTRRRGHQGRRRSRSRGRRNQGAGRRGSL